MNDYEQLFQKKYSQLNSEQKKAVDAIEGPVTVVAGPGTGKTTLLTLRIANILKQTDISPDNILALTFTNAGVHAMRKKLVELIGDRAYQIGLYTFHSFAEHIIKEYEFYFPEFEHARVITDLEKLQTIESIIAKGNFKHITSKFDQFYAIRSISKAIDTLKQEGISPQMLPEKIGLWKKELYEDDGLYYKRKYGNNAAGDIKTSEETKLLKKVARVHEIVEVYGLYQKHLQENHLYDFSDMILSAIQGLENSEDFQFDIAEQYQYILVDEHQDTNEGQNKIVELLTSAPHLENRPNIFTVGDEKQSIYRFQGASKEAFERFQTMYKDVLTVALQTNYRSNQEILDASHDLITESVVDAVELVSSTDNAKTRANIFVGEFSNIKFEALYVANEINKLLNEGVSLEEVAIIYRSNKEVQALQDVLNANNIPHTIQSNEYLLEHRLIQNILIMLRAAADIGNDSIIAKSLFVDFMNCNPIEVAKVLDEFSQLKREAKSATNKESLSLFAFLETKELFSEYVSCVGDCLAASHNMQFDAYFKFLLERTTCLSFILSQSASQDHISLVDKLFDEIKKQLDAHAQLDAKTFLSVIDTYEKYGVHIATNSPEQSTGVQLLTAHKSKGLEFEYVFIVNAVRQNWEKRRTPSDIALPVQTYKGGIDDERRLFYVAMTRAKNKLIITSASTDGLGVKKEKTQFLSEINNKLFEHIAVQEFEKAHVESLDLFLRNNKVDKSIFDGQFIQEIYQKRSINVTALNNFLQCPVSYFFKSLLRLPSPYAPSLAYGDAVHNTLETFFKKSLEDKVLTPKKELLLLFEKNMNRLQISKTDLDHLVKRGLESLGEYYETYKKEWSLEVALEQFVSRDMIMSDNVSVTLNGRLDKIIFTDSSHSKITVVDYKTGKTFSEKDKQQKTALERQLVFYHLLLKNNDAVPYVIESALLDFVEQNQKTKKYEQHTVHVSEEDIAALKAEINEMHTQIMNNDFLDKGCKKKDCEYCTLYNSIKNRE